VAADERGEGQVVARARQFGQAPVPQVVEHTHSLTDARGGRKCRDSFEAARRSSSTRGKDRHRHRRAPTRR
jgi:hypothetical protein